MADLINLTPSQPVVLTGVTGVQKMNLWDAVEVLTCDILDLELLLTSLTGFTAGTIGLTTGMQTQSEDGWVSLATFTMPAVGATTRDFCATSAGSPRRCRRATQWAS